MKNLENATKNINLRVYLSISAIFYTHKILDNKTSYLFSQTMRGVKNKNREEGDRLVLGFPF